MLEKTKMTQLEALDKLQRADHDSIGRIDGMVGRIEDKINDIGSDIKEMKDTTTQTITNHESRLKLLEQTNERVNPLESYKSIQNLRAFQTNLKLIIGFGASLALVVGFVLGAVSNFTSLIHR